jgi:hypothetical protein
MEDWKAKEAARAAVSDALRAANPKLVPANGKGGALIAAAKNIRIELAAAFPGIKFSIKSRRFSGGDAIDVRWTDGPTSRQVDEIIDRYEAGSFSGMDDLYTYSRSAWKEAFGDAKYVHSTRDYSDAVIASCARLVLSRLPVAAGKYPLDGVVEAYRRGMLRSVMVGDSGFDLGDLLYREMARRCCAIAKQLPADVACEKEEA